MLGVSKPIQYFQNYVRPSCQGADSSCLAWSFLVMLVWVFGNFQHIIFLNIYHYPFNTLHTYGILQGYCTNQLQLVLLTVISMCGSGLFFCHTKQAKTRQDVALWQPGKTRRVYSVYYSSSSHQADALALSIMTLMERLVDEASSS